jgi:hypothetical protein
MTHIFLGGVLFDEIENQLLAVLHEFLIKEASQRQDFHLRAGVWRVRTSGSNAIDSIQAFSFPFNPSRCRRDSRPG